MIEPEKRSAVAPTLLLCGSALYLFLNLFASLRVPFLLGGDQAYFWMRAMRLLDGERIYQDFLQFTPPGTDLLFLSLFKLFGLRMWITNLVALVLGLASVWLIFAIARRFMRRESAMLAAAIFLVPIYGKGLNATHHWFGTLAVLAAIRVVLGGLTGSRLAVVGALLGVASFFSLYHGLGGLLAFSIFLLWNGERTQPRWAGRLRRQALLFGAYVIALALLYSRYLVTNGIGQLWYFQVTYVRKFAVEAYGGVQEIFPLAATFHNLAALSEYLVVYLLLGLATVAAIYLCWKRRSRYASIAPAILVTLVAILLFAEVAVSPNWLRIFAVSAPAVILLAWAVDQMPRLRLGLSIVLGVWVLVLAARQTHVRREMQHTLVSLPAGRVATTPQMAARLEVVSQFAKPGDAFFQAAWPGVYVPLHVKNRLSFETVGVSDMPRAGDVELARRQLEERHVPYVLWAARLDKPCSWPCIDRLAPMRNYLHTAYVRVATLEDGDTLWRLRQ
jgi:uncharacterized membrane protein YuzA (DUF378 family)